ncbi:MAG: DUF3108 domain-containing protein [Pseudomonadota bacterium]
MAGAARLRGAGARLAALLAVVLLCHWVTLRWLARELEAPQALHAMPTPMFTRVLQQAAATEPPPPPPRASIIARPKTRRIEALPAPAAKAPEPVASQPAAVASAPPEIAAPPAPEPTPAPEAEQAAASAASAPASAATASPSAVATALDSWPADTRLSYRLGGQFRSGELHGSARVQWLRQGEKYETKIDINVTLLASLVLTSQGEVTPQGLFPRAYEELRGSGPRIARMGDDSISLHDGRSVPRPQGVQDTASQFVELSHRFAAGIETLEVGRSVTFWLARPGGVDLWTYDVVERETLRTPELGNVDAFHLKPRPIANPRGNITAEMWFAPSLQYLPVRIRVTMGEGTFVDLLVDKIEQR